MYLKKKENKPKNVEFFHRKRYYFFSDMQHACILTSFSWDPPSSHRINCKNDSPDAGCWSVQAREQHFSLHSNGQLNSSSE